MNDSENPIELEAITTTKSTKPSSALTGTLVAGFLGMISAVVVFFLLKSSLEDTGTKTQNQQASGEELESAPADLSDRESHTSSDSELTSREAPDSDAESLGMNENEPTPERPESEEKLIAEVAENSVEQTTDPPPLVAPSGSSDLPEPLAAVADTPDNETESLDSTSEPDPKPKAKTSEKKDDEEKREDLKLSKRRWTTLVALPGNQQGEAPLPDKFPVWNYPKDYSFKGSGLDQHRLGNFKIDGEFIFQNGYLRREFGNTALLHLPPAENFDLEGIVSFEGAGGWLMLLGWDIQSKSGYVLYDTKLRVSGSVWFVIEIKDGIPVPDSERLIVKRDASGEGAFRVRVEDKKVSLQVADAYVCKEELLPNYQEGHVALGTFSPQYGPQNIGIKSLRMKLR